MALAGSRPLPWGTINPGGYLGDTNLNDVISQGLQTIGSIFGHNQNMAPTPNTGISFPVVRQPAQAGMFGGISPVILAGVAIAAVLLLKRK
jgi:hypothetical protein